MSNTIKTGNKIMVEVEGEQFVGVVKMITEKRLALEDIVDLATGYRPKGVQYFYLNEIVTTNIFSEPNERQDDNLKTDEENCETNNKRTYEPQLLALTEKDLKTINKTMENIKYLYQVDENYYNATKDIMDKSFVSVTAEKVKRGRYGTLNLITIATEDTVYIFDINYYGKILKELKEIFEADKPKKIFHNSARIADNLKNKYNITINGVYDTLVLHNKISKKMENIDLIGCSQKYLNISNSFIQYSDKFDWNVRPLDQEHKYVAAKQTILLYILHNHLLYDIVLEKYNLDCKRYSQFYVNQKDVALDLGRTKNEPALEVIN